MLVGGTFMLVGGTFMLYASYVSTLNARVH